MASPILERLATLLEETPPFDELPGEERTGLLGNMSLKIYEASEVILVQGSDAGDSLYLVESGMVRLSDTESGRNLEMSGPNSQFGSYGLMQGGTLPYEARASEQTTCALLPAEDFHRLRKTYEAFNEYFREEVRRYVRTLNADVDASGAYLLFDTRLGSIVRREPVLAEPQSTVKDTARLMAEERSDTIIVVEDRIPVGIVTEGDIVRVVGTNDISESDSVMSLVTRPPIALHAEDRLYDAVRTMMEHRIRRVVILQPSEGTPEDGEEEEESPEQILGIISNEDISHIRGMDPVATTEHIERARSIESLASIRREALQGLHRLSGQGVQSEDLFDIFAEVDDQIKQRLLAHVEQQTREEMEEEEPGSFYEGSWAFMAFGAGGRREPSLNARQENGLVWADPDETDAERAKSTYARLAQHTSEALATCGYPTAEHGILASENAFRQPLSVWIEAYNAWATAENAESTARSTPTFDLRIIHGDEVLGQILHDTVQEYLPSRRLARVLVRRGATATIPLSSFKRFELERADDGTEGLDIHRGALRPIVDIARALALDAGFIQPTGTFARLKQIARSEHEGAPIARNLLEAFTTLVDLHLRHQMDHARRGIAPDDRIDPARLHKSQQNLLRETLRIVQEAQKEIRKMFDLS